MLVANKPQNGNKGTKATTGNRREAENMLKDIAFVLKMTARVKADILTK